MLMQQRAVSLPIVTPGQRSPYFTSQIRGLTVKEYDEHLSSLSKENINLKVQIYFMEEQMGHISSADKEDPINKIIELKVMCSFSLRVFVCAASVTAEHL